MTHGADDTFRFPPTMARWLAGGWAAALAIIFLFRYNAWLQPVWLCQSIPALRLGPHCAEFWTARLLDAGWCVAVLATAFATGSVVLDRLVRERTLLTGLFALGVGLWVLATGILIIGTFAVAQTGWVFLLAGSWLLPAPRAYFHQGTVVGRLCESAISLIKSPLRRSGLQWKPAAGGAHNFRWPQVNVWLLFVAVAAVLCLAGALTPPFEYDELEYHLGAPSEYLKAGRIIFLPHNFYSNLPQLTEMLYLLALVMRSGIAAKLLHFSFGLLSATALFAVASQLWSRRVGALAAALFYCAPFVQDLSQTARVDLATTFFATLAFGGALLACDGDHWIWLSALAAGGAVATKWPAIPVVFVPAVILIVVSRRSIWLTAGFCLLASVFVLPWLCKNWFLAGNPVYPLWSRSAHWSAEQAAVFAQKHYARFDVTGWRELCERAWHYSFAENGAVPVLLMTAPLCLLIRGNRRLRWASVLFLLAYGGWWALTFRPWRFLFPALPVAALLGAFALAAVGRWCRVVVGVVLVVGLTRMALVPIAEGAFGLALGQIPEHDFLAQAAPGVFEPVIWMNDNLPATAKILFVGEGRVALARQAIVWATAYDQFPADATNGLTHVYFNYSELNRLHDHYGYPRGLDLALVQAHLGREIYRTQRGAVFEWAP